MEPFVFDEVCVRKGTMGDGPTLCDLICALADYEKLPRPEPEAQSRLVRDAFGPSPMFDAWFGEVDGVTAGYAISFYTYSTFLALPTFYLEDLFVLPEFRARKIGKALFLNCVRVAYEKGCGRMEWQVLHWNHLARDFYHHLGGRHVDEWLPYRATREELHRMVDRFTLDH